ncbi:protein ATP1B4 [Electrophorus electricus]|uniref:Sodium/potassium-transporting ATPase subunit beta n=1 Tax=Electrophorus electricus TaxID=8005 RepID=A0A4W4FYN6_ELEEL|nr:protein ATP1B4 [Electrophorus electricus]
MEPEPSAGGDEDLQTSAPKARAGSLHKHSHELAEALEVEQEGLVEHQPLEQDDLNFERWKPKPKPKRTLHEKIGDLKTYLWNPETKEFMGRSGKSWSLILLFYAALYVFLAAMFAGCMCCLMWSISPYSPTYNDRVMPPGMTMTPHFHDVHGLVVLFNASDRSSWKKYARVLEAQLKPYDDVVQERRNMACTQDGYFMQDDLEESAERKACQFKRSWLGPCSGSQDKDFGYSKGKPCILLRMNRILGYLPGQGTPVNVACGVKKGTSESLGEVDFYPKNIFNLMYYPYYGKLRHVNYSSPLVAVHFSRVQYDTYLHVQCKLHGKGIINDSPTDRHLGSVSFSLEVGA